jgi:hypothetical protein
MAEAWPAGLPNPSSNGYSMTPGDGRQITRMTQGPRRIRKRFVNVPDDISLTLELTGAEAAIFDAFWDGDLDQGMNSVLMPILNGGVIVNTAVNILSRKYSSAGGTNVNVQLKVETV